MITIVCGPPGAGKTTFVKDHVLWGDLVVDFDKLFSALSFLPEHEKPGNLFPFVCAARDAIYREIERGDISRAWVICGGAKRWDRERFLGARIILLKKTVSECLRNLMNDPLRKDKVSLYRPMVEKWWAEYEE